MRPMLSLITGELGCCRSAPEGQMGWTEPETGGTEATTRRSGMTGTVEYASSCRR